MNNLTIKESYLYVLEQIEGAARSVGRDPSSVKLITVTKGHSAKDVLLAYKSGIRRFGENYPDEALGKMNALGDTPGIEWHMIGHVQSRKARSVCDNFCSIHSIDSMKLAQRLDRFCGENGRKLSGLVECNVSGESSKFGFPAWREDLWSSLVPEFSRLFELPNLIIHGLMTMAPFFEKPEPARIYFQRLRRLRDYLNDQMPAPMLIELSMGMSGDFIPAVQEGATWVRIGTAIMGQRRE